MIYASLHHEIPYYGFVNDTESTYKGYKRVALPFATRDMFQSIPYKITFNPIYFPEVKRNWWFRDYPVARYFSLWDTGGTFIGSWKIDGAVHLTPGTTMKLTITVEQ